MPELPEVEIVRRGLESLIVGKTITNVTTDREAMFPQDFQAVRTALIGQTVQHIARRGKYLLFQLSNGILISHLRMEGKFLMDDGTEDRHVHARFYFNDGSVLAYRDVRIFGRFHYSGTEEDVEDYLKKLGPEPTEEALDERVMHQRLNRSHTAIKTVLLNQKVVAGLGNIYVDEVLFKAGILPTRPANALTDEEVHRLREHIIGVMNAAIEAGGSTIRTYENAFGENGTYQHQLQVYGKAGEPCPNCQTPIEKIKLGGRGTHFCPHCQS